MEEKPKAGLVKLKCGDRQHITRKEKLYVTLVKGVLGLATRTQPSPHETEFSWLPDNLQLVRAKTGALCSASQRVKYFMII